MLAYLSPAGLNCTADEALSGGRLKPGYRETVADGEYVRFDLSMRDSAPRGSVIFLTDAPDAEAKALADSIDSLNAWRTANGSGVKVTDAEARSLVLGQQIAREHAAKTALDNASVDRLLAGQEAAYQRSRTAMNDWRSEAAVRDAARSAQYAG